MQSSGYGFDVADGDDRRSNRAAEFTHRTITFSLNKRNRWKKETQKEHDGLFGDFFLFKTNVTFLSRMQKFVVVVINRMIVVLQEPFLSSGIVVQTSWFILPLFTTYLYSWLKTFPPGTRQSESFHIHSFVCSFSKLSSCLIICFFTSVLRCSFFWSFFRFFVCLVALFLCSFICFNVCSLVKFVWFLHFVVCSFVSLFLYLFVCSFKRLFVLWFFCLLLVAILLFVSLVLWFLVCLFIFVFAYKDFNSWFCSLIYLFIPFFVIHFYFIYSFISLFIPLFFFLFVTLFVCLVSSSPRFHVCSLFSSTFGASFPVRLEGHGFDYQAEGCDPTYEDMQSGNFP